MPQSLSNILIHLVFSTKNRQPLIRQAIRPDLHAYLGGVLNHLDCPILQVGGVEDHVHALFRLHRTASVSDAVEKLKASSSRWMKTQGREFADFSWQSGYGAFSVGQAELERIDTYIRSQEAHHHKLSFQDEFRSLLVEHGVNYDEKYVWD